MIKDDDYDAPIPECGLVCYKNQFRILVHLVTAPLYRKRKADHGSRFTPLLLISPILLHREEF